MDPRNELDNDGEPTKANIFTLGNPLKTKVGVTSDTGIGIHWTDRRKSARNFATINEKSEESEPWLEGKRPVGAIITARVPKGSSIRGGWDRGIHNIHPYASEQERPVKPETTVHVTEVEKIRQSKSGIKKRTLRYNPPRKVIT